MIVNLKKTRVLKAGYVTSALISLVVTTRVYDYYRSSWKAVKANEFAKDAFINQGRKLKARRYLLSKAGTLRDLRIMDDVFLNFFLIGHTVENSKRIF